MLFEVFYSFFVILDSEFAVGSRWYLMPQHEFLCKSFAAFQLRAFFRRSYKVYLTQILIRFEVIIKTIYERFFRANKKHIYLFTTTKGGNCFKIVYVEGYINATLGCSRVARSNV